MATATVQIQVYVGTKELKIAIEKYAESLSTPVHNVPVWEIIAETWTKMLASKSFKISVSTLYEESNKTGMDRLENQAQRRFSLLMPPDLVTAVDEVILKIKNDSNKRGINRSSWTQEAIRRYLEPVLIEKGYLDISQFKNKIQAANNLLTFRKSLHLGRLVFLEKYLTVDDQLIVSYPQYSLIERSGKGNIDRILERISEVTRIDKDSFYLSSLDFINFLEKFLKENKL